MDSASIIAIIATLAIFSIAILVIWGIRKNDKNTPPPPPCSVPLPSPVSSIESLKESVKHLGKDNAPLLRNGYSMPMPSADFSTFLAKCFSCRDEISAIGVLNESGLWDQAAQKTVKTCYEFQWEEWFYPLPECLPEIVAVHLLSNRADSIHISNSSTILMMAQGSLFVHAGEIKWNQKNLHKLFLKTNSLLASYYPKKNFPDTSPPRLKTVADLEGIKTPENNRIFDWLKNESPSVREYFFYSDMRSSVTTDYSLRCFGVDDEGSGKRIRDSGFFLVENDEDACLRMLTKADLTAIATQVNMSTRKGWKKEELFSEILKNPEAKQLALQKTPEHRKIKRNPDFSEEWDAIIRFKEQALPVCWAIASL